MSMLLQLCKSDKNRCTSEYVLKICNYTVNHFQYFGWRLSSLVYPGGSACLPRRYHVHLEVINLSIDDINLHRQLEVLFNIVLRHNLNELCLVVGLVIAQEAPNLYYNTVH